MPALPKEEGGQLQMKIPVIRIHIVAHYNNDYGNKYANDDTAREVDICCHLLLLSLFPPK